MKALRDKATKIANNITFCYTSWPSQQKANKIHDTNTEVITLTKPVMSICTMLVLFGYYCHVILFHWITVDLSFFMTIFVWIVAEDRSSLLTLWHFTFCVSEDFPWNAVKRLVGIGRSLNYYELGDQRQLLGELPYSGYTFHFLI